MLISALTKLFVRNPVPGGIIFVALSGVMAYVEYEKTNGMIWVSAGFILFGFASIFFGDKMFANSKYRRSDFQDVG